MNHSVNDSRHSPHSVDAVAGGDDDLDAETIAGASAPPPMAQPVIPTIGTQIDDYEIISEIARGGMGVVYRARQQNLDRVVALKMVFGDASGDDDLKRFHNEARAAAELDHPGIVPVFDVGTYGDRPYFTMAYVDGPSLASLLADGPLPPERAAEIARDVARAMSTAHRQQIIHRDLKPANILMESDGSPRITDFGVCKSLAAASDLTAGGEMIGTPHYMPPEQASVADDPIGPTADVYSIGAVLYTMLTGRPPFQSASPLEVVAQVISQAPVRPSNLNSSLPADLETITLKCLEKRPADRYEAAEDLAADLERFINDEPIVARPPGLLRLGSHLVRQQILLASVSGSFALLLVMLCFVLAITLFNVRRENERLLQQIASDRQAVTDFVSREDKSSNAVLRYKLQRWQQMATELEQERPEAAIQIAAHACKQAQQAGLSPAQRLVDCLATAIHSTTDGTLQDDSLDTLLNWVELAELDDSLTPQDRFRFDLPPLTDSEHDDE